VVVTGGELETGLENMLVLDVLRIDAKAFDVLVAAPESVDVVDGNEKLLGKDAVCRTLSTTLL
jgi:hypothetical protein